MMIKNLKKLLAMALTLSMVMGLFNLTALAYDGDWSTEKAAIDWLVEEAEAEVGSDTDTVAYYFSQYAGKAAELNSNGKNYGVLINEAMMADLGLTDAPIWLIAQDDNDALTFYCTLTNEASDSAEVLIYQDGSYFHTTGSVEERDDPSAGDDTILRLIVSDDGWQSLDDAEQPLYSLTVTVADGDDAPLSDIPLTVDGVNKTTGAEGTAVFSLPAGTYDISVSAGYPYDDVVQSVTVVADETNTAKIILDAELLFTVDPDAMTVDIDSAAALWQWARSINEGQISYSNYTINITADIDLGDALWTPIEAWEKGGSYSLLTGTTINGGNHTISNMTLNSDYALNYEGFGFIGDLGAADPDYADGAVAPTFTVKDLTFDSAVVDSLLDSGYKRILAYTGVVVGRGFNDGNGAQNMTFENVDVTNSRVINAASVGGILGYQTGGQITFTGCDISDTFLGGYGSWAGILVSYGAAMEVTVSGCTADNVQLYTDGLRSTRSAYPNIQTPDCLWQYYVSKGLTVENSTQSDTYVVYPAHCFRVTESGVTPIGQRYVRVDSADALNDIASASWFSAETCAESEAITAIVPDNYPKSPSTLSNADPVTYGAVRLYAQWTDPEQPGDDPVEYNYFTVTVNYYDADTNETIADSYTSAALREGRSYDVTARDAIAIEGYVYDRTTGDALTGSMDGDKVVDVWYTAQTDQLPDEPTPGGDLPTDLPDEQPPAAELPETEIPMAEAPATGDLSRLWFAAAVLSAAGLVWLTTAERKKRETV